MTFLSRIANTKTFWLGIILIGVSVVGLIPFFGYGFSPEALFAGVALITVRDAIAKTDINKLDPVLDKLVGDVSSARIQEFLIAWFVSEGVPEEEAVERAQAVAAKLPTQVKKDS